jgi:hypothetical protein
MMRSQGILSSQFTTLPGDLVQMANLRLLVDHAPSRGAATQQYVPLTDLDEMRARYSNVGQPMYYSVAGTQLELLPAPDQAYTAEMLYHAKVPALGPDTDTNFILANHPDLYLYGALLQASPYLKDDARVQTWAQFYGAAANDLKLQSERAQLGAAPLTMRARSF